MPNETSNVLLISGNQSDVDLFIDDHIAYGPDHSDTYDQMYFNFEVSVPIDNLEYKKAVQTIQENVNHNLNPTEHYRLSELIDDYRNKFWGTRRGIIDKILNYNFNGKEIKNGKILIDSPYTPCDNWFKNMICKYPNLNFSLKYNDEFSEDYYGWAVACKGELIDSERICLHYTENGERLDLFKYYNQENFTS